MLNLPFRRICENKTWYLHTFQDETKNPVRHKCQISDGKLNEFPMILNTDELKSRILICPRAPSRTRKGTIFNREQPEKRHNFFYLAFQLKYMGFVPPFCLDVFVSVCVGLWRAI